MHVICAVMKNLTLRIEDSTLDRAREIAHAQSTSVNALVRDFLGTLVQQETRKEQARKELIQLCMESDAKVGKVRWTREELYDCQFMKRFLKAKS